MSAYAKEGAFLVVGTRSMKLRRFAILSSVFVCFSTSGPAFAATLVVDDDFLDCPQAEHNSIQAAVVAAGPGDKILVCPGEYRETVLVDATKHDLRIEAQAAPGEVVLQGTLAQPFGFHLQNTTGVLVQGFNVQGFFSNMRIEGGSGNTFRKNVSTQGGQHGITINSSANVVEQNTSFANKGPISDGIFVGLFGASNNIIRHNETYQNTMAGITIGASGPGNVVFRNDSYENRIGIRNIPLPSFPGLPGSPASVIENNHVFANQRGIVIGNSSKVIARNNRSEGNVEFGITLQNGATDNLVEKNEVFQNTQHGILLQNNVDANIVQLNLVRRNGLDGIRIFDAASNGNTIERNVIRESGEHDAHDDGTENQWINNKCETEDQPGLCEHPG
jgi:parallel beta-helix repeat protein